MIETRWLSTYQTDGVRQTKHVREKKCWEQEARKEPVTEELYYVRNEGFWANALRGGQKKVTAKGLWYQ
jgi:hypothetical protein